MNSMIFVIPLHIISWKKTPNNAVTPQRQSQFTPKMKANAVPPLLSSLVWIDQYNECNGMTSSREFMVIDPRTSPACFPLLSYRTYPYPDSIPDSSTDSIPDSWRFHLSPSSHAVSIPISSKGPCLIPYWQHISGQLSLSVTYFLVVLTLANSVVAHHSNELRSTF